MNEVTFLTQLIAEKRTVTIRLAEARDIVAVIVGHDANALVVRNHDSGEHSLIYKKSISVITPGKKKEE